jgi:hypothetical protein
MEEHFYFSLFLFLFSFLIFSFFFFFFPSYFLLFFYFLFIIFMHLRTFKQHITCYSSPHPCLNDCSSSSIEVRGPVAAKEYKILVFLYKSFEIFKSILHVETHIIDESLHMLFVLKYCQKIFRKIHRKIIHTQLG